VLQGNKKTRKSRIGWLSTAAVLSVALLLSGGGILFRIRGSVKVKPSTDVEAGMHVYYGQKDPRWVDLHLGTSPYTMEHSGCLVCCIAASLEMQGRAPQSPDAWIAALTSAGAFDSAGNLLWENLSAVDGEISAERCDHTDGQEIMEQLQAGRYPIVRVRVNGLGSFHYVLIAGAADGSFQCMDPLSGREELVPLSGFGSRVYAVRYVDWTTLRR